MLVEILSESINFIIIKLCLLLPHILKGIIKIMNYISFYDATRL
jgi:hypothetical protein